MNFYISKTVQNQNFEETIENVTGTLKVEGFSVLTEIDVKDILKKKINVDFKKYKILGACNPHFAYKALSNEDKIGVFLPCNIVVEEHDSGEIEVSAIDPIASMGAMNNDNLAQIAAEVQQKLKHVIENL
jgi:uncharacterized protein (DUF302 family)